MSFPGFESVYRAKWPAEPLAKIEVSENEIRQALKIGNRHEAVKRTVDLYVNPLIGFSKKRGSGACLLVHCDTGNRVSTGQAQFKSLSG